MDVGNYDERVFTRAWPQKAWHVEENHLEGYKKVYREGGKESPIDASFGFIKFLTKYPSVMAPRTGIASTQEG